MNLHPSFSSPIFPFRHPRPTRRNKHFPFSSFDMRGLKINPKITSCTKKRFPSSHVNRNIHYSFKDASTRTRHTVLVIMSEFLVVIHTHTYIHLSHTHGNLCRILHSQLCPFRFIVYLYYILCLFILLFCCIYIVMNIILTQSHHFSLITDCKLSNKC